MTIKFLKKLYEQRFKDITVLLLDDSNPSDDNAYTIRPNRLLYISGIFFLFISAIFTILFIITPLRVFLFIADDKYMRDEIEAITEKVVRVQDSLVIRDQQLSEMKNIIQLSLDTTFKTDERFNRVFETGIIYNDAFSFGNNPASIANRINYSGLAFSNTLNAIDDFPSSYPVKGIKSRDYDPQNFHFGLDIATSNNEVISSIADGTVVSASWTINHGYVLTIQHAASILSVYKHCASVTKKSGDIVLKGDIIGTVGDVGLSSSGPHLHLEIWKDGVPQDPTLYLIK